MNWVFGDRGSAGRLDMELVDFESVLGDGPLRADSHLYEQKLG